MPLTADDLRRGAHWLVIGTRPGGDRCVLWSSRSREKARAKADEFRRQLEGYASIDLECDDPRTPEEPMTETNGTNRIEAIKAAHERLKAAKAQDSDPPEAGPAAKAWAEMGRSERVAAVRELVKQLGPQARWVDVEAEGRKRGLQPKPPQFWKARIDLGFSKPGSKPGTARPAATQPTERVREAGTTFAQANGRPSHGIGRKVAQPHQPPAVAQPTAPLEDVLAGVKLLGEAMAKLGGRANTLRLLETLGTFGGAER